VFLPEHERRVIGERVTAGRASPTGQLEIESLNKTTHHDQQLPGANHVKAEERVACAKRSAAWARLLVAMEDSTRRRKLVGTDFVDGIDKIWRHLCPSGIKQAGRGAIPCAEANPGRTAILRLLGRPHDPDVMMKSFAEEWRLYWSPMLCGSEPQELGISEELIPAEL
jgi:hypothetical protein